MKLSMWILYDWLADFRPVATITEGSQTIEGIRFFTESTIQNDRYAYISRVQDVFADSASNEVLIMHGNDTISLESDDLGDVFNSTLRAFEYYSEWEQELRRATKSSSPEQDIVTCCKDIFGPMFIMDLNLNLLAFSKTYAPGEVNAIWDEYLIYEDPSLQTIRTMMGSTYTKLLSRRHDMHVYEEVRAAPYSYGIMTSYLDDEGELIGQLAIASDSPITQREVQLAGSVKTALNDIRFKASKSGPNVYQSGLLKSLLQEAGLDDANTREKLLLLMNWRETDRFLLFNASSSATQSTEEFLDAFRDKLSALVPESVLALLEGKLVGLVRTEDAAALSNTLTDIAKRASFRFGLSNPFTGTEDLLAYSTQALIALQHCWRTEERVLHFHACALHAITHAVDRSFISRSLHPAVSQLAEHDRLNGTEYAVTLRSFLKNERSYVLTARELYVHRNTILYRIGKIEELSPIDLDDPYEREYLLASFRFDDPE